MKYFVANTKDPLELRNLLALGIISPEFALELARKAQNLPKENLFYRGVPTTQLLYIQVSSLTPYQYSVLIKDHTEQDLPANLEQLDTKNITQSPITPKLWENIVKNQTYGQH